MSKPTPAPWTLIKNPEHCGPYTETDLQPYWHIEGVHPFLGFRFHIAAYMPEADARLIAASPKLLEACKGLLEALGRAGVLPQDHATVEKAEAAIAEAEAQ